MAKLKGKEMKGTVKPLFFASACLALMAAAASRSRAATSGGDVDLNFNRTIAGSVVSFAVQPDDKVLIGGAFNSINGVPRTNLARLNVDGSLDASFQSGLAGANGIVRSIVIQGDGKLLIGGSFTSVNDTARTNVARLNADGSLDTNFFSAASSVQTMAPQLDGNVMLGGGWSSSAGTTRYALCARLNSNGAPDGSFQSQFAGSCAVPWSCVTPSVNAVAAQADGKVVVGGMFTSVNGVTRYAIARLNANGSSDPSFTSLIWQDVFGNNGSLNALILQPDGRILVGGIFNYISFDTRANIARLNTNGTVDATFLNGLDGVAGNVNALALQRDGKVLVGGIFSAVNGVARHGIARLNGDGTLDTRFQNGMSGVSGAFISGINAVAVQSDGKVLIAGSFTNVNGVVRNGFARLYGDTPPPLLNHPDIVSHHLQFDVIGESNGIAIVEASTNFVSWIPLSTNTLGAAPLHFNDPTPATSGQRFYRARLQ